jgi:hypothetical protein
MNNKAVLVFGKYKYICGLRSVLKFMAVYTTSHVRTLAVCMLREAEEAVTF